jgi:hypothetical protein
MLVSTAGGKSYTLKEMKELLAQAGFGSMETVDIARNSLIISGQRES